MYIPATDAYNKRDFPTSLLDIPHVLKSEDLSRHQHRREMKLGVEKAPLGGTSVPKRGFSIANKKGVEEERGSNPGFGFGLDKEYKEKVTRDIIQDSKNKSEREMKHHIGMEEPNMPEALDTSGRIKDPFIPREEKELGMDGTLSG